MPRQWTTDSPAAGQGFLASREPSARLRSTSGAEFGASPAPALRAKLAPVLQLQRILGNRRVARWIQARRLTPAGAIDRLQRKLEVGAVDDPYEQEADRIASDVMSIPQAAPAEALGRANLNGDGARRLQMRLPAGTAGRSAQRQTNSDREDEDKEVPVQASRSASAAAPSLQTKCPACARGDNEDEVLKKIGDGLQLKRAISEEPVVGDEDEAEREIVDSVESRLAASKGGGDPLPEGFREHVEPAFGADFSGVRVHTDQNAVGMSQDLGAKAFTHGSDIYFNANRYSPSTSSGKELLAHELTHVVQQSGGAREQEDEAGDAGTDAAGKVSRVSKKDLLQLAPNVTAVNGPAEIAAGKGKSATLTATAPRGTVIDWSFQGANNGAALGGSTGRTNTLTAPAGSTGGAITVRAADHANPLADFADLNINLVEVQQPTFAFAPAMPGFSPANTMDASVCGNTATAAAVTAPAARPLTWSIQGNRRGATIDPVTGVIVPSPTQTGNIRIRATDNAVRDAQNEQTLTIQAHPTGITATSILATLPVAGPTYGAIYTHAFSSSGGSIANVMVTERIFDGNNPFGFVGVPVLPGNLNARAGALQDTIGTGVGRVDVNNFLPSPPNAGLPQVMDTPQILYWRSDQCSPAAAAPPAAAPADHWVPFVNVPIKATLKQTGAGFFFVTSDNGVALPPQAYRGPALAAGAPPAASACAAGEGLSKVTFSPESIAADASPQTTTAGTVEARPGGNQVTWSFAGPALGAAIVAQGNPALFSAGNTAGRVRVRAAMTATPACFAEGWLKMEEVEIGPIKFSPAEVHPGATTRATVKTKPGSRIVTWTIQPPALGAVIAANADNSATITAAAAGVGRITVRATDQRDATRFNEASLVIS